MHREIVLLAFSAVLFQVAEAAVPCPPTSLSIDGGPTIETPCTTTSMGGVVNGELFSTDFSSGILTSILSMAWGEKLPTIVTDSTALSGRALRFDWDPGFENYNGVFQRVTGNHRKLHVRILLKQGPGGTNSGIQKIIRFRPQINGAEAAAGTVNFQWGNILFGGDNYGDGNNHIQSNASTHGPDTFVNRWRYLEVMLNYSDLSVQHIAIWVDGTKVLDKKIQLQSPMPSSLNMNGVMFLGTFNGPATDRFDYIGKIDISKDYMGIP